jgi:DNA-binding beta-propeller fold protein YncE
MRRPTSIAFFLFALLASPSLGAASTHEFAGIVAGPFYDPCGIALDESQNLAVAYRGGTSPITTNTPCDLVYAGFPQHLFGTMQHGAAYDLTQGTVLDPERSTGIAVGPSGRIYVAHRHQISVYEAEGTAAFSVGDTGSLGDAYGVAVDGAGRVYVGDAASDTVKVFDPGLDPLVPAFVIDGAGAPTGAFTDLTDTDIAIEPNGNVLVVDNLQPGLETPVAALYEFSPTGEYVGEVSHWSVLLIHAEPSGVAVAPDGTIYLTSGNFYPTSEELEEGVVYRFSPGLVPTSKLRVVRVGDEKGLVASRGSKPNVFSGIHCGPTCTADYKTGDVVDLVATASAHAEFLGWSVAGQPNACLDPNSSCKVTLSAAREVTAKFTAIPQRDLQVSVSGQGLVSSTPSRITCRSQCSAEFDEGSQVILTPEPAEGFRFAGFSGACSGQSQCNITMTGDITVGVDFVPSPAPEHVHPPASTSRLLLIAGGEGTGSVSSKPAGLDCGLACSAVFPTGTAVALEATADPGARFVGWSGCDSVTAGRCRIGMTGPRSVTALFAEGPLVAPLGKLVTRRSSNSLAVAVAEAGRLTLAGKGLRGARRRVAEGGRLMLPLQLDKQGQRAAAAHGFLRTQVVVRFDSAGEAAPETVKRTVVLRRGAGRA